MTELVTPVLELRGVGEAIAERLERLGIRNTEDLLYHFPRSFKDYSQWRKIGELRVGETVTFRGKVEKISNRPTKRRGFFIQELKVADETGEIAVRFFNQRFILRALRQGVEAAFAGSVEPDFQTRRVVANPVFEVISGPDHNFTHVGRIVPVYPLTEGLAEGVLRRLIKNVLPFAAQLSDFLPAEIRSSNQLIDLNSAIQSIHFPESDEQLKDAEQRLAFDELFLLSLRMQQAKAKTVETPGRPIGVDRLLLKRFVDQLPFTLTDAQRRAAWEIVQDLARTQPMQRLLNGDVGSGKTVVAALAALNTIRAGYQVAIMAPTEILANQHRTTLKILEPFGVKLALVTSSLKEDATKADLLIGTHALLEPTVPMPRLAFVVIDEQHRFGVEQRRALLQKSAFRPHLLTMTATPIPRTLALTLYGNLSLSILDELPAHRQSIVTRIVLPERRASLYEAIAVELTSGRQVFVVTPVIDPTAEASPRRLFAEEKRAVTEVFEEFSKAFPTTKVGMLHGRLRPKEKDRAMQEFVRGTTQILVATTVVEVGIDVPNATVMVIEGAEHFGLAQLHQLRGRVGRSHHQSYCYLVPTMGARAEARRLQAMIESNSGFDLAEKDLAIRGPGQFLGTSQSGFPELRLASFLDMPLVKSASQAAAELLTQDQTLNRHPLLKEKVESFGEKYHLE